MSNLLRLMQQAYQRELGGCRRLVPSRKGRFPVRKFTLNIRLQNNPKSGLLQVGEIISIDNQVWRIAEGFDCDGRAGYVIESNKNAGIVYADELEESS